MTCVMDIPWIYTCQAGRPRAAGHRWRWAQRRCSAPWCCSPAACAAGAPRASRSSPTAHRATACRARAAAAAAGASRRPAAFSSAVSHGLSAHDWFEDPHANFPRNQLKYVRELGRGWFGRAVEGEARGAVPGQATTRVVVKILHEDATPTDHMFFLHEARPYRDLRHPNVLRLVGRCLETDPFLVVLEACSSGDLKSFLSQNISTAEALSQQGVTLLMCCQVAAGLQFMHQHGFVHTDLAARNCLVTSDLTVKIGDYGISIDTFKEDYYCTSDVALPIRWCAPETLHCTDTTIETKEVTPCANVWSLGVVLWEICEFGKLPYEDLSDDEVIVKVLVEVSKCLPLPSRSCPHRHNLYHLMKLCWSPAAERPALPQVLAMLDHLYGNREFASIDNDVCSSQADEDFERRWETFKPNSIPVTDNHVTSTSTEVHRPLTLLGNDMVPPVLITSNLASEMNILNRGLQKSSTQPSHEILLTPQETPFLMSDTSPLTTSPQPSLTSSSGGEIFLPSLQQRHKSPSLQNLRGSLDDLSECNSQVQIEDYDFVKQEAISEEENRSEDLPQETVSETINSNISHNTADPVTQEPDFDSWLQGVETTDEEDAKFVRKISEAIRDLDNALALEKTSSSSSSPASSKSGSHHQSPSKDVTPVASDENVVLDFRLGPAELQNDIFALKNVSLVQPDSLLDDSLVDKSLVRDTNNRATDSGTDTEDETWRKRIECGEFTAKVKEKSKSVADLMVLTHIDCSDGSDSEPPSLTWTVDRGSNSRNSFSKQRRGSSFKGGNLNTNALAFVSESNIHQAVLGEEFRNTLLKLHEAQKDQRTRLGSLDLLPLNHETVSEETLTNSADPLLPTSNFLCDADDFENMGLKIDSPTKKENNFLVDNASEESAVKSKSTSLEAEADSIDVNSSISGNKDRYNFVETEPPFSVLREEIKENNHSTNPENASTSKSSAGNINNQISNSVSVIDTQELSNFSIVALSDNRQPAHSVKAQHSDGSKVDSVGNLPISVLPSNESCPSSEESESAAMLNDNKAADINDSLCEEKFAPEVKSTSTPKRNSLSADTSDSIIEVSSNKNESKKVVDFDGIPETTKDMETSLSNSSLILSNSDSRDATFNSSEVNVHTNVSVQSGISTDSFEFVPVVGSEPKPCSTPTDPLEIEHKEISSATINENMSNSISEGSVILGPCEDYTLDYFKGLKTISNDAGPFLSDDSDHAESANISDSSEEDEPNVLNCKEVRSYSTNSQTEAEPNLRGVPDTSSQTSESCQTSESVHNTYSETKTESDCEVAPNDCQEEKSVKENEQENENQQSACVHITETCLSKVPLISVKGNQRKIVTSSNAKHLSCEENNPGVQEDCSKHSVNSFTPDSLEKQIFDGHQASTLPQNSRIYECLPSEVSSHIDSPTDSEKHSEVSAAVLEGESTSAQCFPMCEKEDVLSMDPDSLNEPFREKTLVDTSIDSIEASKESSMSCITSVVDENCGHLVVAETSSNLLSSGIESSEGKSEISFSNSLENEVPTVVAGILGQSSDSSNVEYDSSDTLVSLDHSLPEIELQDKTLSIYDNSPSPELFKDKKAASYAFLQQEINTENLYRQKAVINTCTLETVFSQSALESSQTFSEKDPEIVPTAENCPNLLVKSDSVETDIKKSNVISALNQPSTSSIEIIEDDLQLVKNSEDIAEQNINSIEQKEIIATKDENCDDKVMSINTKISDICEDTLPNTKTNTSKVNSNDMKSDVEAACKTVSHFIKDVPLKIVPNIYSRDEVKEPLHVQVSEVNPILNLEKSEHTNIMCSPNDHVDSQSKPLCFNDSSEGFFDKNIGIEKWKQSDVNILNEEFLHSQKPSDHSFLALGLGMDCQDYGPDFQPENDTTVELDDGEDYGLDVAKHSTPDDERSSDSGFRDKGSLSESCEDACDEKYNLEDIEAELEETFNKGGFTYVVKGLSGDEDDLEHHTSSEELPHEHLADHNEISPCEIVISSDADVSESASEETFEKKQTKEVNILPHLSSNSDGMISDKTSTSILKDTKYPISSSEKAVVTNESPSGTPDLLNIETNDTPMPDVTSPHGTAGNKKCNSVSQTNSPDNQTAFDSDLKSAMSDGFDVDIQSRFCQEKDLILDIGQTEFRALSPEESSPFPMDSGETSPVKKTGWFLHPPAGAETSDRNFDDNLDDVFMSPKSTSSSTSNVEEGNSNENHYELFSLNEEFVTAIRNELQEKLPCARQQNQENPENDGILEPEDETLQDERTDITIHYNVYPPPLSPILEERESVSSITTTLSDNVIIRGAQQPESDSEPASPVFVLDSVDLINAEADAKRFEEEIREALENCSVSSVDTDSFSDKDQKNKSVLLEDLEDSREDQPSGQVSENTNSNNVTVIKSTSPQSEYDDDFLVIDTETNQATLLESPKPKSHLAFIKKQLTMPDDQMTESSSPSDILKNEVLVMSSDESTQGCLKLEVNPELCMSDDDAFTPDSISPRQDRQILSYDTSTTSTYAKNHDSDVAVSSSEKSSVSIDSIELPPSHGMLASYSLYCANINHSELQNPTLDVVQEISIGVTNNEAAEIISELENSGIIDKCHQNEDNDSDDPGDGGDRNEDDGNENVIPIELETSTKFTCEDSSRTESDGEESGAISLEESSDSLKSPDRHIMKKSLSLDFSSLQQGMNLKRFQSHDNISVNDKTEDNIHHPPATIEVTVCEDEEDEDDAQSNVRLNDTLDLFKKKKAALRGEGSTDRDWSVTSLETAVLSTKAPMPSPEDESWKQIPSMLAFSDLNEMMSRCNNEEDFNEGYAEASSPGFPSHDNDEDLMSTSFSLKDSEDIGDCYTPDWESEDDTNEEDNNSSSSGEFIWKEGDKEASVKAVDIQTSGGASKPFEGHSEFGMEVIAEEEEDEEEEEEEDDDSMSSESGTEFIPSAWNSEATPNRSALRSPDKKQEQKKNVSFKKQKYHCVYEYPREASDSESEGTDSPSRRRWDLYQPDVDYASYADWELMEGDVAESSGPDIDTDPEVPQSQPTQTFDFYKLSNVDCDFSTGVVSEDGEFYISSSARPFQFSGTSSDIFGGNGSEFFPGQLYRTSNDEDLSAPPPTEITDVSLEFLPFEGDTDNRDKILKCVEEPDTPSSNLMGLETCDDQLNAKITVIETLQISPVNIDLSEEETIDREQREKFEQNSSTNFIKEPDTPGSPLDSSPTSPLSPTSGLGELRHTRDRLKLDLPTSGSAFVLEPPALNKRRSVETIKGEASLLDSGEETEDSGIESSNGTNSSKISKPVGTSLPNLGIINPGKV